MEFPKKLLYHKVGKGGAMKAGPSGHSPVIRLWKKY
jgi:hypothetical protein